MINDNQVHIDIESKFIGIISILVGFFASKFEFLSNFIHYKIFSSAVIYIGESNQISEQSFTYEIETLLVKGLITLVFALITCIGTTYISFHIKRYLSKKHKEN